MNDRERREQIGVRAARLCYEQNAGGDCHNFCVGSCAAVCPSDEHLIAASRSVFTEYWAERSNFVPSFTE